MSLPVIDLSHFKKKVRGKIKLSIFMSELLHLIYLVIKNYRNHPDQISKYETFWRLVRDRDFIKNVLMKESWSSRAEQDPLRYFKLVEIIKERGYTNFLELADIIWDLTVHHKKIDHRTMFNNIIGLKPHLLDKMKFYGRVSYKRCPFIMDIKLYKFLIIEAEVGKGTEALAKSLIYIGSLTNTDKTLGLFARFSVRSLDNEHMVHNQNNGYAHKLLKMFKLYPTVLRMQRLAYKKVEAVKGLENELISMLSELYVDDKHLTSIINMDVPANILTMAPSISLSGGLCIATVFRGELLDVLGAKIEARIKVADTIIKAYPSYHTVLPRSNYPGEYVFLAFHPFTIPRISLMIATYKVDILDKIKPRRRNISSLDKLFPKIHELVKTYK